MTKARSSDPLVGDVLDGRYEVRQRLARGGMATVYRAWDRRLERIVAIKVMHEGLGDGTDYEAKFDREARLAAGLCDQNVVSIFDQGVDHGRPYIVMEFVQGPTLRNVITKHAPFTPLQALQMIEPVAAALAVAHEAGLIHRDVKPENVLISESGAIKVADFGLARSAQSATVSQGVLIGTVSYLPPELLTNHQVDAWSDVYSVGIVLFEMLTGQKPYTAESPIGVVYRHINEDVPEPSKVLASANPSLARRSPIPDYIDALVLACTRRNPAARPNNGRDLLHRVRRARRALERGVGDDETLVAQMFPASMLPWSIDLPAGVASVQAASRAAADTEHTPVAGSLLEDVHQAMADQPAASRPIPAPAPPREPYPTPAPRTPDYPVYESGPPANERFPKLAQSQVYRRRRTAVSSILIILLAAVVGVGTWWFAAGRYATTPSVINMTQEEATAIAQANGFTITFTRAYSETVPEGQVITTDPAPGERAVRASTISAVISLGPERFAVPAVVGLTLADARLALNAASLNTGEVTEAYSETIEIGHVISAGYDEGELLKRDTAVDLVISKGREPIDVPNVVDMTKDEAVAAIEATGLVAQVSEEKYDNSVAAGLVISQSPTASSTLFRGDTVTLVVSLGPEQVTVPNVVGKRRSEGVRLLQEAGFDVDVVESLNPFQTTITSTNPKGGTQAPKGSTVTVTIGNG